MPPKDEGTTRTEYPSGIPDKFDPDGNVQYFPGNAIISHLSPTDPLQPHLIKLYEKLRDSPLSRLYTLLPPSSWHMTIFEGVCDQRRDPDLWPSDLALDASLSECTSLFQTKLRAFDLGDAVPPYRIAIEGFKPRKNGISVLLEGRTPEDEAHLRGLRDSLADELRIRHPSHLMYKFHLTVAYFLRFPTDEQQEQLTALLMEDYDAWPKGFDLGAPEFCVFDDMFAFQRLFYMSGGGKAGLVEAENIALGKGLEN